MQTSLYAMICGSLVQSSRCLYKSMCCLNGLYGKLGCTLKSSKSTAIIEREVLRVIRSAILTPAVIIEVVKLANAYLKDPASRPREDERPLRAREKSLRKQVDRLLHRVKYVTDQGLVDVYEKDIIKTNNELRQVAEELTALSRANAPTPPPLDVERVEAYIADMRAILKAETPIAAEAIRRLTDPILVSQKPHDHTKHGAR
jgi:hypothetical protein